MIISVVPTAPITFSEGFWSTRVISFILFDIIENIYIYITYIIQTYNIITNIYIYNIYVYIYNICIYV